MNQILLEKNDYHAERDVYLLKKNDPRFIHIQNVLKLDLRDQIKIGIVGLGQGMAEVTQINETFCELKVKTKTPTIMPYYQLMVGICRPLSIKKILEHGTSLGVKKFHFVTTTLSDKSYLQSKVLLPENCKEAMLKGLSQSSLYTELPEIKIWNDLEECLIFTEDIKHKFFLSLKSNHFFPLTPLQDQLPLLIALGPERGWTKGEEEKMHDKNFIPIKISASTLRVEIATFVALGQLELLRSH
ncbi:MAG: RNA methyltransferase [Bacteriovoracaceae bacterium]|nr:RNA methyltransferase [Bacteriovoracaceae bacterium]